MYRNTLFAQIIVAQFYNKKDAEAIQHPDAFNPIQLETLALVASAVRTSRHACRPSLTPLYHAFADPLYPRRLGDRHQQRRR